MNNHTLKLIDGYFPKDKARALMLELIAYKINHHAMQKFSNEERFGQDQEKSEARVKELANARQELTDWMHLLSDTSKVKIDCKITLKVRK